MNFKKKYFLFFYLITFFIFLPSFGLTENLTLGKTKLIKKEDEVKKYNLSAKVIPIQPLFRLEKTSSLNWSKDIQSPSSNWKGKHSEYNWKPDDHMAFINIPLHNNFTKEDKTPKSLDGIQIEYHDLFPENPSQFSLEMDVLDKETTGTEVNKSIWKNKSVIATSKQLSSNIDKARTVRDLSLESLSSFWRPGFLTAKEDLFSAPMKKKNSIYLFKRSLGLPFKPTWRYIQDDMIAENYGDHTVVQRRFHMDLRFIEFIDIVFRDDATEIDLQNFRCNFRIAYAKSPKTLKVVPHYKLAHGFNYAESTNQILSIGGKKTIRFNIGSFVRNAYKNKNVVFLKEMIIFLPGLTDQVLFKRPIQSIKFFQNDQTKQRIPETFLDISSTQWVKKDIVYLLKHEMGFPTPPNWRYSQDKKFSVFERALHKDLHEIKSMDFILNKGVTIPDKIFCQLQVGFSNRPFPSKTINCNNLSKEIKTIDGQRLLRIQIHDLVHQFYAQGKKRVFLEGLTFYLAGSINYYIENPPLKTIQFFKLPDHESRKICFNSSKTCSQTEFLSRTHKRYIVNMAMMSELIGPSAKLTGLTLKIKPQIAKAPSGFKLIKARATLRTKNNKLHLNDGKDLVRRWGGPFYDLSKHRDLIEKVRVNTFYSFQSIDKNISYESGISRNSDITIFSSKNTLHRLRNSREGINCDFIFFSKDATLFLELPSIGPFLENRLVQLDIKTDGPFNLVPTDPLMSWSQSDGKIRFQLKKGTTPKFKINVSSDFSNTSLRDNLLLNFKQASSKSIASFETRGLINIKKVKVHGMSPFSQDLTVSFSKPNSSSSNKPTKVVQSGGMKISTQKYFDKWNLTNKGLLLEGNGKWIEIDWKLNSRLHKNSRFFLKTSKNTDSVLSSKITPFSGGQPLPPIKALLNQPIQLGGSIPGNIDSLKIHLKLNEKPFKLILKEMAIFEPISASTDQIIDLSSFFHTSLPLTPSKVKNVLPSEVSVKKGQLKATLLTNRGISQVLDWSTEVNQKLSQIKWVKIKYLVSPSIHANNSCWLKLFFLSSNQKFEKTICTKSYDGEIWIPVTNYFTNKTLKSIHWTAQVDNQKKPLPLFVTLDLTMSIHGLSIDTIRNNTVITPIVEVEGKRILPVFLKNLPANKAANLDSWWDLGVISTNPKFDFNTNLRLLTSPYLSTQNLFLERVTAATSLKKLTFKEKNSPTPNSPAIQISIWERLFIIFISIFVFAWAANTRKAKEHSYKFFSVMLTVIRLSKIEKYPHLYLLIAATVYFLGLLTTLRPYQSQLYTLGAIISSLASYNFAKLNYYKVANSLPPSLEKIFTQKEMLLTSLFLFFLTTASFLKIITLDQVAEQATIIGFIMLCSVIYLRMFKPFKETHNL
ncbi:MAG: hypothetical protein HN474_04735 [Nitrospina sp.]|nr:hypothetical protein [Nitrospina sp.]